MEKVIAVALLTNAGVAGDGIDKTYAISPESTATMIQDVGKHNVNISDRGTTLRGWQTESDVALPTEGKINAVMVAIGKAQARLDNEREKAISALKAEVVGKLGETLLPLFEKAIADLNPGKSPVSVNAPDKWVYATAIDDQLSEDIAKIRKS